MVVTFCGHREVYQQEQIADELDRIIEKLIMNGADQFLLGGYEQFDMLAARVVAKAKVRHPNIESVLVIPYLDRQYDTSLYDRTLYPALENVPRRFAILKRNEYMVDAADIVVAYVKYEWGGAAKALEYARRRKKQIMWMGR